MKSTKERITQPRMFVVVVEGSLQVHVPVHGVVTVTALPEDGTCVEGEAILEDGTVDEGVLEDVTAEETINDGTGVEATPEDGTGVEGTLDDTAGLEVEAILEDGTVDEGVLEDDIGVLEFVQWKDRLDKEVVESN
ncbi:hypothetical protein PSN45_003072 [Yamadazyma tenuis]|uniref:uncharacterized protein n=1 Tax=Candida tenuis TaxID=2315449 RepID=UPI002798CD98|nr:hypothetical protein PSN45_003072 [Yamadazyma tenuis]